MSTTLTNGLKLPDKGSVDWYADMQSNYQILDGAVGTVAQHTSQIAGKAPAVHTHTKSDITDLFNSANTWSALNTYNGMVLLKLSSDVAEQFKQKLPKDVSVSSDALVRFNTLTDSEDHNVVVEALGHWASYVSKSITLKYKNDSTKIGTIDFRLESNGTGLFYPQSPFKCNLGNSTNKWKTLNGINPGALSLPNFSAEFDVSGQIVPPTGETQINIAWGKNTFTPSVDGWLSIRIHKATVIKIYRESRASYCFDSRIATADDICVCSPVVAGVEYTIKIQATQFSSGYDHFRLSPCQGNV